MNKRKKILIVVIVIASIYFALPTVFDQFKFEHVVIIPKSEYKIGEKITIYGISMHSTRYGDGCGPKLQVYNQQTKIISTPENCTTAVIHEPALKFYQRSWDQEIAQERQRIQVPSGQYLLEFMGKSLPITIAD